MTRARKLFRPLLPCLAVLAAALLAKSAAAGSVHVRLDTSAWLHYRAYLEFTYTTSIPESVVLEEENRVQIHDLTHDGQIGEDETQGGVSGGRHNACAVQPLTWVLDPDDVPEILGSGRYRHTSVAVNFATQYAIDPDLPWLGSVIEFELELPASSFVDPALPPDAFAMMLLNADRKPGFPTADPLGADALLAASPRREGGGWRIDAFEPARLRHGTAGAVDTILVRLPPPPPSAGPRREVLHLPPRVGRVARDPATGVVWIEYGLSLPAPHTLLRVLDSRGRECFRRERHDMPPGNYGQDWPEGGQGPVPPPGAYRVVMEVGNQLAVKEVEL
jgi:hypothetical protein